MKEIRQLDKQEVDWDTEDDDNSSFMQRDRLIIQYGNYFVFILKLVISAVITTVLPLF